MSHLDQAAALATVDKTPEQLEAERQQKLRTEMLAGWAEQAAKLAKADPSQCQTSVYRSGSWYGHSCSKTAKYHREESLSVDAEAPIVTRHYCATHDPVLKKEREDKKRESEKAQYDLRRGAVPDSQSQTGGKMLPLALWLQYKGCNSIHPWRAEHEATSRKD
jgi:hypothetical protein